MKRLLRSRVMLLVTLLGDLMLYAGPGPYDYTTGSYEMALAAQKEVTDDWLTQAGVVGTAIGVDGKGRAVLKVYVTDFAQASVPGFTSGVQVVTEFTEPFVALPAADVDPKRGFPRPVPIGVSAGHGDVTAGTLGARVTDGTNVYALSNNHVFAANNGGKKGDNLLQPGVVDGGRDPADAFATLYDYEPIRFCGTFTCPRNKLDAAIALTSTENVGFETPEGGYGAPRSTTQEADLGLSVQKFGRTTGHTVGRVTGINATIDVGYRTGKARFEGQIVITGSGFSAGGDSGSLIVTKGLLMADRRPVGLLFAGTSTTTIANPIDLVLDRFDVRIDGN